MNIFHVVIGLCLISLQCAMGNNCTESFEDCCKNMTKKKPCDQFDCEYYEKHKDKEYTDDSLMAQYNDPILFWFEHKEYNDQKNKRSRNYECMLPDHLQKRSEYDALPGIIDKTTIFLDSNNWITRIFNDKGYSYDGVKTVVHTNLMAFINFTLFTKYGERINIKGNFIWLDNETNNNSSRPSSHMFLEAPLEAAYPKYKWLQQFVLHKNSSPPWVDALYNKEYHAWARGSRYIMALSELTVSRNGTNHTLSQIDHYSFGLEVPEEDNSRYIHMDFMIEDVYLWVSLEMIKYEGLWKPELLYVDFDGSKTYTTIETILPHKTYYSVEPITMELVNGSQLRIGRLGAELNEEGVGYYFSGTDKTREETTSQFPPSTLCNSFAYVFMNFAH